MAEVARRSRALFSDKRFHIPPNLYHILQHRGFSPSIHQLFLLSRLTNYRLVDWLAVFDVSLEDIPRLQAVLAARYTTLIDTSVYDDLTWILSFEQISSEVLPRWLCPLGERLRVGPRRRYANVQQVREPQFLYAKIGCHDAFAFPDLLPGSIVRVTVAGAPRFREIPTGRNGAFFLLEHARGLTCSRLHVVAKNRVMLCPSELPFAHIEFELGREARILGAVDFELRSTAFTVPPRVPRNLSQFWIPEPLEQGSAGLALDKLLRRARLRSGFTFREASAKSAMIARALQKREFFCAAGSLSDYESSCEPPRHVHKLFSLCTLYSLNVWDFATAAGLRLSEAGKDAMPEGLLGRIGEPRLSDEVSSSGGDTVAQFPYFFGRAVAELFKMDHLSIRDLFWIGSPQPSFHPYLADAAIVIVDRRRKRITTLPHAPLWAQPLYVLLGRDSRYFCTSCIPDGKKLVMRPFSDGFDRPLRFRSPQEIEVAGSVVGILRRTVRG